MGDFKIKVEGLEKLENYFKDYMIRKKKGLLGIVADTSQNIRMDAIAAAPVDLGELRNNIRETIIERKDMISGDVLSAATYSAYVEYGSRPHWTGKQNLQGWADRHGIPVYLVQKSIAEKGTPAQPFMGPAAIQNKNPFVRNIVSLMSTK